MRRWTPEFVVVALAAIVTRGWNLFEPRVVIWDEVLYQKYVGYYLSGAFFVDAHPPFGKLLLAALAHAARLDAAELIAGAPAPVLRLVPSLAGALLIPVFYLLLRELGAGRRGATLGAAFVLLDGLFTVHARLIVTDSILLLTGVGALLAYALARRTAGTARGAALACAAALAGLAAGTKWTGLSALGLMLAVHAADAFRTRDRRLRLGLEASGLAAGAALVYALVFVVHFALLPNTGRNDGMMPESFQATLRGNAHHRADARVSRVAATVAVNRVMWTVHDAWATYAHPGASPWYTWPISKHSITMWQEVPTADGRERWIVLVGNPVVWWGALLGMAGVLALIARRRGAVGAHAAPLWIAGGGYALNFVPFAAIERPMFLYHYEFALLYGIAFTATGVAALAGWSDADSPWRFVTGKSARRYWAPIVLAGAVFLFLAPLTYGTPVSHRAVAARLWLLERHF
jgi:dolichyl-phosphate-mannose-protein mannosyltransferase